MAKKVTKDEFILRSLSKIQHKQWELFVVSRIINGLVMDDGDVEFVCQQLIRRSKERYALTDLYFPQFGIF
ncbi:MAG: AbaSI family restriction endonuclease [Halocynthiibacter sp.]